MQIVAHVCVSAALAVSPNASKEPASAPTAALGGCHGTCQQLRFAVAQNVLSLH